ncbi:hypothetical protein EAG_13950 [Camponotus floridanus]|uniref:Uncharacterized protein n=1 Tax=Camponotus floridanus TaxID=104421 RepID=E2ABF1_CAMFO|nr:hypothetical protein EAG_13950 [Camponotus floridanus]
MVCAVWVQQTLKTFNIAFFAKQAEYTYNSVSLALMVPIVVIYRDNNRIKRAVIMGCLLEMQRLRNKMNANGNAKSGVNTGRHALTYAYAGSNPGYSPVKLLSMLSHLCHIQHIFGVGAYICQQATSLDNFRKDDTQKANVRYDTLLKTPRCWRSVLSHFHNLEVLKFPDGTSVLKFTNLIRII